MKFTLRASEIADAVKYAEHINSEIYLTCEAHFMIRMIISSIATKSCLGVIP